MPNKKPLSIAVIALVWATLGLFSAPAQATLQISLDAGGGNSVVITDNGAGDINSLAGALTFSGSLGNFIINVTTGLSKPILGTDGQPNIDLSSVNITSINGGGTLTILVTDTGFTATGLNAFRSSIGGTVSGGTLAYSTFEDNANTPFGTANSLCTLSFGVSPFSGACATDIVTANPYSLTLETVATLAAWGGVSYNAALQIPEPSAMLLLGAGLVALAAWGNRRIRRKR